VWCAPHLVTNTNDSGDGSLRQAILSANLSVDVPDVIGFSIPGSGPHTITPLTPLPALTDPVLIDGYSQPSASSNTLTNGDNAVLQILLLEGLVIDTTNSAVRGLALRHIQVGATPGPKGSNIIEGCFIGLDATGTNSLGSPGFGVLVQTPSNRVGGTRPAARNVISGKGATGIEIFEAFASNNVVQGNFIGTDRTGTRAIGNTDRAVAVNMAASAALIGGSDAGARNVISGNLNRGIALDGSRNRIYGNLIGTTVTGQPLGNARSGIEIGGSGNFIGGSHPSVANVIAFNGVDGGGFPTNGVDVKPGTVDYTISGNSIFGNMGRGIDVNADNLITTGFPMLTLVSNTSTATLIEGTHTPNSVFGLELFTNPAADPSGYGEGKTPLLSTNITADGAGKFSISWPTPLPPGLFVTATANGRTEFSEARPVTVALGPNSWTNNESGKWEEGANWSLNVPPFVGHSLVAITNAGTKTVRNDATTAAGFPTTLTVSNLLISAPSGETNTLLLAHGATSTPLHILRNLTVDSGGALMIRDAALNLAVPFSDPVSLDGELTLDGGTLTVTNNSVRLYVGNNGPGTLTVSKGTLMAYYPIVGAKAGANGTWDIAGGTNIVTTVFDIADSLTATGTVKITGGLLSVPVVYVGLFGNGRMFVSNGTFQCATLGLIASQDGSQGTFIAAGGTSTFGSMMISGDFGATGSVLVAGNAQVGIDGLLENHGTLTVTGGDLLVFGQVDSIGQTLVSGGAIRSQAVLVGNGQSGGNSTFRLEGGTLLTGNLEVNATGQFLFNQGTLQTQSSTNNPPFVVGDGNSLAVYQLLGGTNSFAKGLTISSNATLTGTGAIIGSVTNSGVIAPGLSFPVFIFGQLDIHGQLVLNHDAELRFELSGYEPGAQFGFLTVTGSVTLGGSLSVSLSSNFQGVMTNGAGFTLLTADTPLTGAFANVSSGGVLTTTDGYARFTVLYAGATSLQLTNLVVVDTDGDGLPDWWEDLYQLNKNSAADAALDLDGDGASNLAEFRAGTLPNNPDSVFRIVAVQREAGHLRLTWSTVGGKSYRVQTNAPSGNGSFTNNFADFSPVIAISGMGESTTNYLDASGSFTNTPARYYRVRVEP
jgi:hypothetical protein